MTRITSKNWDPTAFGDTVAMEMVKYYNENRPNWWTSNKDFHMFHLMGHLVNLVLHRYADGYDPSEFTD